MDFALQKAAKALAFQISGLIKSKKVKSIFITEIFP